ncbi:MAG TPA: hypothetical protein VJU86_17045 [Pyrinomonadaceae bacterium]|nr:hypothetical protein [Pyrinomonadaceae bacterium]
MQKIFSHVDLINIPTDFNQCDMGWIKDIEAIEALGGSHVPLVAEAEFKG